MTRHNEDRYAIRVILSWADATTRQLYERERSRRFPPDIQTVALRKLKMLNAAIRIDDLLVPPSNRLEKLKGDRAGPMEYRREHAVANLFPLGGGQRV